MGELGRLEAFIADSSLSQWIFAVSIAVVIIVVTMVFKKKGLDRLEHLTRLTHSVALNSAVEGLRATRLWLVVLFAILFGCQYLDLSLRLDSIITKLATIVAFVQVGLWLNRALAYIVEQSKQKAMKTSASSATSLSAIGFVGRMVLWAIIALLMLDNLGIDITALVAGLGIGGIAVALAVQSTLSDLLASLSIVIDKPFVLGDFIIVDDYMGTVENIGVKTTRLRSLGGEQLVFANSDLLKTRIRNYKRMYERRVVFGFNITLNTSPDKLEWIGGAVKNIITSQQNTRFDRAHFFGFGESYFTFEVVYYVLSPDYNIYMDIQQSINLAMLRAFEEKEVKLAAPARVLHVDNEMFNSPQQNNASGSTPPLSTN
ncbi:mechanosensitive ion channel family protein [Phytohalomonas tamaricis]|uniref:mechanosensitive ion channel family protein n=1 Tax=Phytohalomonas tamaricis TaxID=2081032 RepID=UPI0021D45C3A|nr:mechanosensitive ion channel family protein [Phytohalomonas tamaricis]